MTWQGLSEPSDGSVGVNGGGYQQLRRRRPSSIEQAIREGRATANRWRLCLPLCVPLVASVRSTSLRRLVTCDNRLVFMRPMSRITTLTID
jgi:hypothetical protein